MKLRKIAAILMAAVLMLTLCVTFVSAEDSSAIDSSAEAAETQANEANDTSDGDAAAAETQPVVVTASENEDGDADDTDVKAEKTPNWDAIIAGGVVLLALIVLAIVYLVSPKFKEKVNKFFKSHISELKKVVWSPARDVKKNTVIVIVLSLGFAILIGLLDFIFSKGIIALSPVIKGLISGR